MSFRWRSDRIEVGDREVEPVSEHALAVYPHIAVLTYYPDLTPKNEGPTTLSVGDATFTATANQGSRILQDRRSRSKNSATLWLADAIPFGLAKFAVTIERDQKLPTASAEEFKRSAVIEVEMTAVEIGNNARTAFPAE